MLLTLQMSGLLVKYQTSLYHIIYLSTIIISSSQLIWLNHWFHILTRQKENFLRSRFATCPCFSHSWGVHQHVKARRGHGLHTRGRQPLPHVPQRAVHEGADSRAEGQHGRGQTLVRRGPVHQPNACQDHAETGNCPPAPPVCSASWEPAVVLWDGPISPSMKRGLSFSLFCTFPHIPLEASLYYTR